MKFLKKLSLVPKGLRYKLMISFCLMSIIPLLVALYLARDYVSSIFLPLFSKGRAAPLSTEVISVSWVLFFGLVIAYLGLVLAKQVIKPIIEMSLEARLIAEGDFSRRISVEGEDEIGDLGHSINQLTRRIKGNMEELKAFGEKTRLINVEIHRRVIALSSLLQIGESISASVQMEDVMTLIVDKIVQVMDGGYAMLFLPKTEGSSVLECNISCNVDNEKLSQLNVKIGDGLLGTALAENRVVYSDVRTKFSKDIKKFSDKCGLKNFAAFSVISRNRVTGMVLVGNELDSFFFKEEDLELIQVFAKQAAIAFESNELARKVKQAAIKDELTDLYNKQYIKTRLEEEIKRAIFYQRPCSYIHFNIDEFGKFREENGELATEKLLIKVADIMRQNVTQVGRAARLADDEFALLLPEKNKKEAYKVAEEVRRKVERLELQLDKDVRTTISGGVSENPLDGSSADELMKKAADSVDKAKVNGKNRIA